VRPTVKTTRLLLGITAAVAATGLAPGLTGAAPTVPPAPTVVHRRAAADRQAGGATGLVAIARDGATPVIYLNRCRGGCTVTPGLDDATSDTTTLVAQTGTLAEFAPADEVWDAAVACARRIYAPYDIELVEEDPGTVPHFEVMIAGVGADAGRPSAGGVGVGACGSVIPNSISMVFANTPGADDAEWLCYAIAQETAHNLGLDHELEASDPTTYLPFDGPRQFVDAEIACGETEERDCCAGPATQNTHQYLMETLGPRRDRSGDGIDISFDGADADGEPPVPEGVIFGCAASGGAASGGAAGAMMLVLAAVALGRRGRRAPRA
jgi:hypothetical protein